MPDWGHGWNGWITICPVAMTLVVQYRIMGVCTENRLFDTRRFNHEASIRQDVEDVDTIAGYQCQVPPLNLSIADKYN